METVSDNVTDEVQDLVPECLSHCLETENQTEESDDLDSCKSKRRRITYSREFLIECFRHPACSRKPRNPLPNLECTLSIARLGTSPFATLYVAPSRKDNNGRKELEDNISLRPQSGNFASGCAPNLSPAHFPPNHTYNRYPFQNDDNSKNLFDRAFHRNNNFRYSNNVRLDSNEQIKRERDSAGRNTRNNNNKNRNQPSRLWGPGSEAENNWIRRGGSNMDRDNRGHGHYRHHPEEDLEPEWFSGGPTSQDETIELHGFHDDERRELGRAPVKGYYENNDQVRETPSDDNAVGNTVSSSVNTLPEDPQKMDFNFDTILQFDHITELFPVSEPNAQPERGSRFSKFFLQNSSEHAAEEIREKPEGSVQRMSNDSLSLQALFASKVAAPAAPADSKAEVIKGMETELRHILLRSNSGGSNNNSNNEFPVAGQPKEQPKSEDLNAFKKLLEDLFIKNSKTGSQNTEGESQDKGSAKTSSGPPPGMPFNPFALNIAQPRPPQPNNNIGPNPMGFQVIQPHSVSRVVDQQYDKVGHNQKRSATPVLAAFTPTAVMRKMTADQQSKSGASLGNTKVATYSGMPQPQPACVSAPTPFSRNNLSASQPNPINTLSNFMSAVQNQPQHLQLHQANQSVPPPNLPGPGHPHPGHVPLPQSGFHPPRVHYPVVVGHPNPGMPGQFPPFMIYSHQMSQRK